MSKKKKSAPKREGQRLVKCKLCDWTRVPFTTNKRGQIESAFSFLRSHFRNDHAEEAEKVDAELESWNQAAAFDLIGEHVVGEESTSREGTPL